MSSAPVYERLISDGIIDRQHELALTRYAACRRAAEKIGYLRCGSDSPDFPIAQFAAVRGSFCAHVFYLLELLTQPYCEEWTFAGYAEEHELNLADIDQILGEVGTFLERDHQAEYRAYRAREEAGYARRRLHPDERPAFLRIERPNR